LRARPALVQRLREDLFSRSGLSGPTCSSPGETCIGAKCRFDALAALPDYRADWAKNPPSACGAGTQSQLTIGQGQDTMAPLADGATLQVECGPQGGHHLWLALSMKDLAQSGTTTTLSASVPGTSTRIPPTAYAYAWSPADGGACELVGLRFQLDVGGVRIEDVLGKPLDIRIDAEDRAGRKAIATKHINVSPARSGVMCR
jgi:hypothetical protein